ncbi:MAG: hypothetical protein Q8M40_12800 [Legionella sp.]|nr:hypothetical protein [Legionella sp.]
MPQFLYDQNNITPEDLKCYEAEIQAILTGQLSQSKKLAGMDFHGRSIYRIKADKKKRLIFTYMIHEGQYKLLILNALEDHKYEDLKKRLKASTTSIVTKELDIQNQFKINEGSETVEAVPYPKYNDINLVFDKDQHEAMQKTMPLLLTGVPGGGKTVVLFNLMLSVMDRLTHLQEEQHLPVLFLSQSPALIDELQEEYRRIKSPLWPDVQFGNWDTWIDSVLPKKENNPEQKLTIVTKDIFNTWVKENWPNHPVPQSKKEKNDEFNQELHYELSLIQALGVKTYQGLGARQSYFTGPILKEDIIKRLVQWQDYLNRNQLSDPMVSTLNLNDLPKFAAVFGDEFQNLPPLALFYFIKLSQDQRFVATIDIEQCLVSSPYNYVTLKQLMYQHYGAYSEYCLTRTWRCPPNIAAAASHLINIKHAYQNTRRLYSTIKSAQTTDGSIQLLDEKNINNIKKYGQSAKTVVLNDYLTPKIRLKIQSQVSSNNILSTKQVIGLDFEVVILWEPISTNPDLHSIFNKWNQQKSKESKGIVDLTLEEEQALSALFVSITRAQKILMIYESKRFSPFLTYLLGNVGSSFSLSPQEKISELEVKKQFTELAERYLKEGKVDLAKEIMHFHLKLSDVEIATKLTSRQALATTKTDFAANQTNENNKPQTIRKRNRSNKAQAIELKPTPTGSKPESLIAKQTIKEEITNPNQAFIKYASDLIQNPSEGSLNKLFSHKNVIKLLFENKSIEGLSLLSRLLRIIKIHNIIIPLLDRNTQFRAKINIEFMQEKSLTGITTFEYLMNTNDGFHYLASWVHENPSFASTIDIEFLKRCFLDDKNISITSIAQIMASMTRIFPFMFIWLKNNPKIAQMIPEISIFSKPSLVMDLANIDVIPLYLLCTSKKGIEILINFLKYNTARIKQISAEKLCEPLNRYIPLSSILHLLVQDSDGIFLLKLLLGKNANIAQNIIMSTLFESSNISGFKSNLFFNLTKRDPGIEFFLEIINLNHDLVNSIKASDLINTDFKIAPKAANLMSLFNLASSNKGCELLSVLIKLKPEIFTTMPLEVFQFNCELSSPANKNETVLKKLLHHNKGIEFLTQLLEERPDFGKLITKQTLLYEQFDNSNLFDYLLPKKAGVNFLNILLYSYPELISEVSSDSTIRLVGTNIKLPHSLYLSKSLEGIQLLQKINPKISTQDLYFQLVNPYSDSEHSILFQLLKYKQLSLLESILATNPYLPEAIKADLLLLNRSIQDESEQKSLLAPLLDFPKLVEVLHTLLKKSTIQTDNAPNLSILSKNINQFFTIPSFMEDTNEDDYDEHDAITEKLN